jgi:hyperosmotically inducible protein
MKTKFAMTCVVCSTLIGSAVALAADDSTSDTSQAVAYVKDSAITTDIKTKLAAEHITSLERIHVETDKNGVVWLSGTARTQTAADKAVSIARVSDHVTNVHSDIRVKSAD